MSNRAHAGRSGVTLELPTALMVAAAETPPAVALVLGSGLGALARHIDVHVAVPFTEISGMAAPSVEYHRGLVTIGHWAGKRVLVFEGRLHYYEGHPWEKVELLPRIARRLGASVLILTNSAG